jgi:hypothetical protein
MISGYYFTTQQEYLTSFNFSVDWSIRLNIII